MKKVLLSSMISLLCSTTFGFQATDYAVIANIPNAIGIMRDNQPTSWELYKAHPDRAKQTAQDALFLATLIGLGGGNLAAMFQSLRLTGFCYEERIEFQKDHLTPLSAGVLTAITASTLVSMFAYWCQTPNFYWSQSHHTLLDLVLRHPDPKDLLTALTIHFTPYEDSRKEMLSSLNNLSLELGKKEDIYRAIRNNRYENVIRILSVNRSLVNRAIMIVKAQSANV